MTCASRPLLDSETSKAKTAGSRASTAMSFMFLQTKTTVIRKALELSRSLEPLARDETISEASISDQHPSGNCACTPTHTISCSRKALRCHHNFKRRGLRDCMCLAYIIDARRKKTLIR